MTDTLFRPEVIEARRHRLSGTVCAAVPPSSRHYTLLAAAVVAAILMILAFGGYASASKVRGVVAYDAGLARVSSTSAGEVRQILVTPGQAVAAGAPLLILSTAQGPGGLATQLAQIDSQIAQLDRQLEILADTAVTETAALREQRSGLLAGSASLQRQQAISARQIGLMAREVGRYTRLAGHGAGSQHQIDQARNEWLSRRAEHEALNERLIDARSKASALAMQIRQHDLDNDKARAVLLAQRSALVSQRADLERADHVVLTAPVAGEISDVGTQVGQHIPPQRSLVSIIPRGSQLETWLYAPSSAIGFARAGQQVRLRFDAFPYQRYGWGRGTVVAISRDAVDPDGIDPALKGTEPMFRVRVRIDSLGSLNVPRAALRPGMTLSADLVLRRSPLWALLLGPLAGESQP